MNGFTWPVRVYYEDTDGGGVVYHSNYLAFMERARTEWLRSMGVMQSRLREEHGVIFAVTHVSIDYLKPAVFDDLLHVQSRVVTLKRASMYFEQSIVRAADELELCRGEVKVACLDAALMRPCAIPKTIKMEIQSVG